jgi:hypothetical protein
MFELNMSLMESQSAAIVFRDFVKVIWCIQTDGDYGSLVLFGQGFCIIITMSSPIKCLTLLIEEG